MNEFGENGPPALPAAAMLLAGEAVRPRVEMRPILLELTSANHSAPSGPAAMPNEPLVLAKLVKLPDVVMRPMFCCPCCSVNHRLPSAPAAIPKGEITIPGFG